MQFISIVLAFLDMGACNLIRIIPGILECKLNLKYTLIHFSSKINFIHIVELCIKIYANCTFNDLFRLRNKDFAR